MKNKIQPTTLTVGICAFNEEKNIAQLIDRILKQKGISFLLEKIIIVNDMSYDSTGQIVKKIGESNPQVILYNQAQRSGKSGCLSYLYSHVQSDVLITFDADVTLVDESVIENIVTTYKETGADLIYPRVDPLHSETFFGKIVFTYEQFWRRCIDNLNNGSNIHRCLGCCMCYSRKLYSQLQIPRHIQADDHFTYLYATLHNLKSSFCKSALIQYKVPETFSDYLNQFRRYSNSHDVLISEFGDEVKNIYKISTKSKLKAYFYMFTSTPVYMTLACILQIVQRISLASVSQNSSRSWETIASTK